MNKLAPALLLLAACGDNLGTPDAHATGDAPAGDAAAPLPRAVIVAGDFGAGAGTGVLSTLDVQSLAITRNAVTGVADGDPFLRRIGDELLIINRSGGNNVTILDAKTLALKEQLATGANSNPQDVAVVGQKLYVPALGTAGVVVLTRGSNTTTTIDLGMPLGDPDGKPDCVSAYAVGTQLFVACGLLDGTFTPRGVGQVAVIDTATDTFVKKIALPYQNPQNLFVQTPASSTFNGDLLIPTVPSFSDYSTGCVARVSSTGAGCAITNHDLGGFPSHMDVHVEDGGALLWMAVASFDASFNGSGALRGLDLMTGALWPQPVSPAAEYIGDVAACPDGSVVATDLTMSANGLRVYAGSTERTTSPISIGLPPNFGNNLVCFDAR